MSETDLVKAILLEFGSRPDLRLWRQNCGAVPMKGGRFVRFGIPGMSDIMGVLAPSGQFVCIECKTATGRLTQAQKSWLAMVTKFGGLAIVARSVEDVRICLP